MEIFIKNDEGSYLFDTIFFINKYKKKEILYNIKSLIIYIIG